MWLSSQWAASFKLGDQAVSFAPNKESSGNKGIEDAVIASDSEAIQTKPQMRSPSLDCFALLAMTDRALVS